MAAGVMATTAPAASTSVLERTTVMRPLPSSQRWTSPQVRDEASERLNPASDSAATRAKSNFPLSAACSAVSKPRSRLRGCTAVSRMTARTAAVRALDWRCGFERRPSPSLQSGAHARVPAGRFQLGPLVSLADGGHGEAHGGDAGAGGGAGGQVTGDGEGLRRKRDGGPTSVAPARSKRRH